MKLEPSKQIMNNRQRVDALAVEVDLHKRSILLSKFKLPDAKRVVKDQLKHNESDPYFFGRTVSGLMNGSVTPRDLHKSRS